MINKLQIKKDLKMFVELNKHVSREMKDRLLIIWGKDTIKMIFTSPDSSLETTYKNQASGYKKKYLVSLNKLSKIIDASDDNAISLTPDENKIIIKEDGFLHELRSIGCPDSYYSINHNADLYDLKKIGSRRFIDSIKFVLPGICKNEAKVNLCKVRLENAKVITTDAYRLHASEIDTNLEGAMPKCAAKTIARCKPSEDIISIGVSPSDKSGLVICGHVSIKFTLFISGIDFNYPNVKQFLNREQRHECYIDYQTMDKTVKKHMKIHKKHCAVGKMVVVDGQLSYIALAENEIQFVKDLKSNVNCGDTQLKLEPEFISSFLSATRQFKPKKICFQFTDHKNLARFIYGEHQTLIMPIIN